MTTQNLLSEKPEELERSLCLYSNKTDQIQVLQITNVKNFYFEGVVFPGDRLLFEAVAEAELEIYTSTADSIVLLERINCDRLSVIGH